MKTDGELHPKGEMRRPRGGTILGEETPKLDELLGLPIPLASGDQAQSFVKRLGEERKEPPRCDQRMFK